MKKILIGTDIRFWEEDRGNSKRLSSLLSYISANSIEIHVYYVGFVDKNMVESIKKKFGNVKFYADNFDVRIRYNRTFKKKTSKLLKSINKKYKYGSFLGSTQPKGFSKSYAWYRKPFFNYLLSKIKPTSVLIEYISLAYLVEDLLLKNSERPLLLVDTHDVLHLRNQSFKEIGVEHWVEITKKQEIHYLDKFDTVLAIQNTEKGTLEEMLPGHLVIEVPYPFPITKHKNKIDFPLNIGFIGSNGPANKDAISGFIENVWPSLRGKYKDLIFLDIYGSICEDLKEFLSVEGVRFHGRFKDLSLVYEVLDIIINPVRSGGGLKIKNVEALSHSLPLVTTPCGSQGLEDAAGKAFISCRDYTDQIEMISELIEDPDLRLRLSENAYQYALNNFSDEKCYRELLKIIG